MTLEVTMSYITKSIDEEKYILTKSTERRWMVRIFEAGVKTVGIIITIDLGVSLGSSL